MRSRGPVIALRVWGAFGALAAAAAACSLAFPLDGYGPGARDAASESSVPEASVDAAPEAGCVLEHAPDRPPNDDPGAGPDVTVTFAIDFLNLGFGDAGPPPGYDLDGLCTCPDPAPCVGVGPMCDLDGGVDDSTNDLLSRLSSFGSGPIFDQTRVNQNLSRGSSTLLLALRSYNGKPNDQSVELAMFVSDGTPTPDGGGDPTPPKLDGQDIWTIDRGSVIGGSGPPILPRYIDTAAYVAGGVLVGHVDAPIILNAGSANITLDLSESLATARIVHETTWRLTDGRIAGRWSTRSVLTALAAVQDPFKRNGFLCGDSGTYQSIKPQICQSADIMTSGKAQGTGQKCNAISIGIGFEAIEAQLGPLADPVDAGGACGPTWTDECPQ